MRDLALMSICLSVTEVHWRIIANLGFKNSVPTLPRIAAAVLLAGGSSRARLGSLVYCDIVQ